MRTIFFNSTLPILNFFFYPNNKDIFFFLHFFLFLAVICSDLSFRFPFHKKRSEEISLSPSVSLIEETDELATGVLPAGLLVVHDASGGGEDQKAEMARGEDVRNPLLELGNLNVVPDSGKEIYI